ncbi:hypothetical protein [Halalkalicoccus subterraneus]|uniref:hypothetical protein n=1 Tax=Halalkalicoccus subterraneus TaxID=2675002 RepID=UPI001FEA27E5|nr:hypothetical protein [Halalkalicoccus subterraneus]
MDFEAKPQTDGAGSVRSLYGRPQHEERVNRDWERGYYGESEHRTPSRPIEFVPEVEYRNESVEVAGNKESVGEPRARPLSASD